MIDNEEKATQSTETKVASKNEVKVQYYDDEVLNRPRQKKDKFSMLSMQLNLPTPQRKGFVRQWVIDKEKRIFEAREWFPVKGEDGNPMRQVMNRNKKEPEYGTYMEIPERYFQENIQADDEDRKAVLERRITNKEIVGEDGKAINATGLYTPSPVNGFVNKIERNNN